MKSKPRGVRVPEPDFKERTIITITPTTYSSRSFMEPTATYKKRIKEMKREKSR